MLGDVAVAVNPDDDRWRLAVGREVLVPFVERAVPVIADERVDPEFGTGALKVTPGHDPLDFEIGRDHGLPEPMVIGPNGRMNDEAGELAGLTQKEADARIVDWLRERELLEGREAYRHTVALCVRCKSRMEPLISLQWWCRMDELKKPAVEALRSGRVRYHPESQHRFAIESLENAPEWNISRQIWWGHQLPVWECPEGHETVEEAEPGACATCGSRELTRSTDVLDTWFSSALWPFAILGWPEETPELDAWYPGSLNTTARDIIRLWENRMIFSGLEMMGEVPFRHVIIHTTLLAPDGRRMSKSLGTGIDPLDLIDQYGADATRYGLLKLTSTQDVRFSYGAVEEGRKLANKLWNASRLVLGAGPLEGSDAPEALEERWIVARLEQTRRELEHDLETFDFAHGVDRLYHLTFDDFCDWYLEAIKPRLSEPQVRATAFAALERLLKLLHPVMPHVTEEIWSNLPDRETRLIVASWPEPDDRFAADAIALDRVQEAASIFRRSAVRTPLEGDELRIFEAVVRPERVKAGGDAQAEIDRLEKEIARGEDKLANNRFVQKAPPEVVEAEREKLEKYRRELDAIRG
jgi:valyl-tRNA synthetase